MAKKNGHQSPFNVYVPVGVTFSGRTLFQLAFKRIIRKFAMAERKHDWKDKFLTADRAEIVAQLRRHVEKGDPRDVAVYCCILIYHNWQIKD